MWLLWILGGLAAMVFFLWWPRVHRSSAFTDTSVGLAFLYAWPALGFLAVVAGYIAMGEKLAFRPVGSGILSFGVLIWLTVAFIGCFGVPLPWPLTPRWVLDVWRERRQERRAARRTRRAERAARRQEARR